MYRSIFIICSLAFLLVPAFSNAAGVSPTVLELTGLPGETIESSISIINTNASDQVYYLDLLGFASSGETGAPTFFDAPVGDHLVRWIKFRSDSVTAPALSKGDVAFTVSIPDSIPAGGYYAAITVSQAPADIVATNGAIIEAKTASLVLLRVGGAVKESLALLDLTTGGDSLGMPPQVFRYRLQNQGNVHLTPTGSITLTNWFGKTIQRLDANRYNDRVLPSSTRAYEVYSRPDMSWGEIISYQLSNLAFGKVKATLDLSYGSSGSITSSINFWIIPWQLLITLGVMATISALVFRIVNKKVR
jgi:hypothetical protein